VGEGLRAHRAINIYIYIYIYLSNTVIIKFPNAKVLPTDPKTFRELILGTGTPAWSQEM
jgi:hypothetical protein